MDSPERSEADQQDFLLNVEEVFNVTGRGPVVVGPITSGVIRNGETVEIWQGEELVATARATVDMVCRPGSDPATVKHNGIGLVLSGLDQGLLRAGQTVRRATPRA